MKERVDRLFILNEILNYIGQVADWAYSCDFDFASECEHKAEALIEILEVIDCGSTGGFDPNNPLVTPTKSKTLNRFLTLCNKRNGDLEKVNAGNSDFDEIINFFTEKS